MTELLSYEKGTGSQFAWDATSIELAQTCLRKYWYKNIRGLRPKSLSVHLLFGKLYADALEHFYKYIAEGATKEESLHRIVHECLTSSWDYETNTPRQFDHNAKTRVNLVRSIVWYIDQFADEAELGITTHHLADGKPAVELSFTLEISDDLVLCGHLDRVVKYGDDLYVMDQKTTGGVIGPYFFRQFKPSNQMSLYTWAGKSILSSPVAGVIIDGAQIAVGFTRFERGFTHRTPRELDEWFASAQYTIDLARLATERNEFPMNLASCGNYGGCEYRSLCSTCPSVRGNYERGDFEESPVWDPLVPRL